MTTTADTTHIAEIVDSLKERLGTETAAHVPAASTDLPTARTPPGHAPAPAGHRRPTAAWTTQAVSAPRTAAGRRDVQIGVALVATLAAAAGVARRRRH